MLIFCVLHAKINTIVCSRAGGAKKIKKRPCFIDIYAYFQAFLHVFTRQKPYPYPYPPIQNLTHFLTPVPSNFFLTLLLKTLPYGKQNGPIGNSGTIHQVAQKSSPKYIFRLSTTFKQLI